MRFSNRLIGLALAASVSLAGGFAKADTVAATTTAEQVRALAQQGLQPLLQLRLMLIETIAGPNKDRTCHAFKGLPFSYKVQSVSGSISSGLHQTFTTFQDRSCKSKALVVSSVATETMSGSTSTAKVSLSAKVYDNKGAFGGTLSVSGAFGSNDSSGTYTQTAAGKFTAATTTETLAVSCDWSDYYVTQGDEPLVCSWGSAQDLDGIGKNVGSVVSLKMTAPTSIGFLSGDFKSVLSGSSLTVGLGAKVPSVVLKGASTPLSHSTFALTGNGWKLTDKSNNTSFRAVASSTGAITATISRTSSGAKLATMSIDPAGNGTITYLPRGTSTKIVFWTLTN
ncbi:hypothetical protein [Oryzibacter oryziterrae]|uniref:hypothetical protein n=1 Tax=Oryzibacter oryziterrae TaxID=2766474 RepID=UPI001F3CF671|nr:hypothetical protein [Oryzibacter oryziterrae]